jgi:hypothetical protein
MPNNNNHREPSCSQCLHYLQYNSIPPVQILHRSYRNWQHPLPSQAPPNPCNAASPIHQLSICTLPINVHGPAPIPSYSDPDHPAAKYSTSIKLKPHPASSAMFGTDSEARAGRSECQKPRFAPPSEPRIRRPRANQRCGPTHRRVRIPTTPCLGAATERRALSAGGRRDCLRVCRIKCNAALVRTGSCCLSLYTFFVPWSRLVCVCHCIAIVLSAGYA